MDTGRGWESECGWVRCMVVWSSQGTFKGGVEWEGNGGPDKYEGCICIQSEASEDAVWARALAPACLLLMQLGQCRSQGSSSGLPQLVHCGAALEVGQRITEPMKEVQVSFEISAQRGPMLGSYEVLP